MPETKAIIVVSYDSVQNKLTCNPDDLYVPSSETIYWQVGSGVSSITGVVIGDSWPFDQPAAGASTSSWLVDDRDNEGRTQTYKYCVSVMTTEGAAKTLDPRIIDEPR